LYIIQANLDLFDWRLDAEAIDRLDELDRGQNIHQLELDDEIYGVPA
jgi:diketogulonate reductase-like aldo/keto reductase